jgi:hypothetical protein
MKAHEVAIHAQKFALPDRLAKSNLLLAHPIYFVKLSHLASTMGLRYAKPATWRYFIKPANSRKIGVAEVSIAEPTGNSFASFSASSEVRRHYMFLRSMVDHDRRPDSYGLRMVRISSLRILAVWLRSTSGKKDVLIPLGTATDELRHGHSYPRREFEAAIHAEAERLSSNLAKSNLMRRQNMPSPNARSV